MKRICFNIANVNAKGGEERMCTTLANSLVDVGYSVFIASIVSHKETPPFYYINDKIKVSHILGTFIERRINQILPFLKYAEFKYKEFLKENMIDIIIDVDTDRTPFTSPIAQQLGIKHIAWDHFYYGRFKERTKTKGILPFLKNGVDKMVVLTKDDERLYNEDAKIPISKIVQIYNSSPIEENVKYKHNSNTVLAMGRLQGQKGFDMLIDAWTLIGNEFPDWRLKIVGDGGQKNFLLDKINKTGMSNIVLTSATRDPRNEYLNADIFVLSSRYEGLGLVLLEAANMSLPLVSFDCDNGPREIVQNGINGFLVEPNNVKMLAEKIKMLIADNDLRQQLSNNALASVSRFRGNVILKQWIDLIETI